MEKETDPIIHDLRIMEASTNYRDWIYSHFKEYLGGRIIEMGAGIGNLTELFLDREIVVAVDNYPECVNYMKRRFSDYKNVLPLMADISSPDILNVRDYSPDTIVCINVLEHTKSDVDVLSYMSVILRKGGRLALLVPAFQFLYGSIDRLVGHYRRYDKKGLLSKLTDSGFSVNDIFYMNSIAVAGWFLNNRILRIREESPVQVFFFDKFIAPWLRNIENIVRPPFGMSIIVIAEKMGKVN